MNQYSDPLERWSFVVILCGISLLWAYLVTTRTFPSNNYEFRLPTLMEMSINWRQFLSGVHNGYYEAFMGYGIFFIMAVVFLSVGRTLLNLIFSQKMISSISSLEKFSFYYLSGSVAASFVWFILGSMGYLSRFSFYCVYGIGFTYTIFQLFFRGGYRGLLITIERAKLFYKQAPLLEKILAGYIAGIVFGWSVISLGFQYYSDTLLTHLTLPQFYIQHGRVMTYAFHIHSYFPQNTEMLVMNALLFSSEPAAALVIWSFFASVVFLLWGFLKRWFSHFAALASILTFLSAPVFIWFAGTIKNDLPAAVFLIAHYLALLESLELKNTMVRDSLRWALFSGLLCGAAVGHKLVSAPIAMVSGALIFSAAIYHLKTDRVWFSLAIRWTIGFIVTTAPWLIRTTLATGNPIYPYLNNVFGKPLVGDWHQPIPQPTSIAVNGIYKAITNYFQTATGLKHTANGLYIPQWGLLVFFISLAILCLRKKIPPAIRFTIASALLSWAALISHSLEFRYHMGVLIFLISIPVAFVVNHNINQKIRIWLVMILTLCTYQTFRALNVNSAMLNHLDSLISGFSEGNHNYLDIDRAMVNLRWMGHLINHHTEKTEGVLQAGISYAYPIERTFYFSSDLDKQIIITLAEESLTVSDLKQKIKSMGVNHLLVSPEFLKSIAQGSPPLRYIAGLSPTVGPETYSKIVNLIQNEMRLRIESPDRSMAWYSFNDNKNLEPIELNQTDAVTFPIMFLEQAKTIAITGDLIQYEKLLKIAIETPMQQKNKGYAYYLLARLYRLINRQNEAVNLFKEAIKRSPELENYIDQ